MIEIMGKGGVFMNRWIGGFLALMLCVLFCACSREEASTASLLGEQLARIECLPQGEIYRSGAAEGEVGYCSDRLLERLYGPGATTHCLPLVEEYAIYLSSFAEPCEIAIFRCYARSDTDRIAEMCLGRIEQMRILLAGTDFRARADRATVSIEGCLVVMQLLP